MTDLEFLRSFLEDLLARTRNSVTAGYFWVGDKAAERRVNDDVHSGALAFSTAHKHARRGLDAIERGELDLARAYLRESNNLFLMAVELQLPADGLETLRTGAMPRGRRATTKNRNAALALAVAKQEALGLSGSAARNAALKSDPDLNEAFADMSDAGVRKALRDGRARQALRKDS